MAEGLKRLGLPLEGTHHRGGDDARNIARIAAALLGAARGGLQEQRGRSRIREAGDKGA
jgi:inhibitor of KinA sporulation pathway (predicted exonuclease)